MNKILYTATEVKLLKDGKKDATILLTLWFLRKMFWPLFLLGLIGGLLAYNMSGDGGAASDAEVTITRFLSPLAGSAFAIILKIAVNYAGIITSYPIQKERSRTFPSKKYGYFLSRYLDTWQQLKGISTLRFTHHVRQEAAKRLDIKIIRNGTLDRVFDILVIVLISLSVLTLFYVFS